MKEGNIVYDLKEHPQDYIPKMLYMMRCVEITKTFIYSTFPSRNSVIPKYITIDTSTVIRLLMDKEHYTTGITRKEHYQKHIVTKEEYVWGLFFYTENKCFKPSQSVVDEWKDFWEDSDESKNWRGRKKKKEI